jgi:hypothetical protein
MSCHHPDCEGFSSGRSLILSGLLIWDGAGADLCSFYEWRDPSHTRTTLATLTLLSITAITTPSRLLVKGTLFAFGFVYFVLAPIWHRYPQYRLLASPLKWIFWKVPTHSTYCLFSLPGQTQFVSFHGLHSEA